MIKKLLYILIPVIILGFLLFYFLFYNSKAQFVGNSVFTAISPECPIIIKVNDADELIPEKILVDEMWNSIESSKLFPGLFNTVSYYDSLLIRNNELRSLLTKKEITIAFNYGGKNELQYSIFVGLKGTTESEIIVGFLENVWEKDKASVSKRKYDGETIFDVKGKNGNFSYTIAKGIFVFSEKTLWVEDAIRQLNLESVDKNPDFAKLNKTSGNQSDINVFINHHEIGKCLRNYLNKNLHTRVDALKTYAGWTEIDVDINESKLYFSGFSTSGDDQKYLIDVIDQQEVGKISFDNILPSNTAFFYGMYLSDVPLFIKGYEDFLQKHNKFFQRKDKLMELNSQAGTDLTKLFIELISDEMFTAAVRVDQNEPMQNRVWGIKVKSSGVALQRFLKIKENYLDKKGINADSWKKVYQIDDETTFDVHRFPLDNMCKVLFGNLMPEIKTNWIASYDNYLFFTDTYQSMTRMIKANVLGETLNGDINYNRFQSNVSDHSNIFFYVNPTLAKPLANIVFNKKISNMISADDELRKFRSFAWQVGSASDMLYNSSALVFNPIIKSKPQTIWQSHLKAPANFKPEFVVNHYDRLNKEIVVQDKQNNFYLINNVGRILWSIKTDGKVLSEVFQIDYYRNGKLQYLFNTANKLYLIDRNGNNVANYPVSFRSKATNGCSVFDYDNNKKYRFFVVCEDQIVYAYNKEGNLVKGWNLFKTESKVKHPVQHFRVEGKDYIVVADKMRDYILNRRGDIRVNTDAIYEHAQNVPMWLEERTSEHAPRMVCTDSKGNLHYTYFSGDYEMLETKGFSENHYFVADNFTGKSDYEYIFVDGNEMESFNNKMERIGKVKFDYSISHSPNIYSFSNGKKVGLVSADPGLIHLMDIDGVEHEGFPLEGGSEFSIGFISSDSEQFNLLVCSKHGYLYNYYVE